MRFVLSIVFNGYISAINMCSSVANKQKNDTEQDHPALTSHADKLGGNS